MTSGVLSERVAVVTGAGRGIGRAIALAYGHEGADLVLAARTESELEEVARQICETGRRDFVLPTDMRDEDAVTELADIACAEFGRIDILVNNAGWGIFKPVLDLSLAEWEEVLAVNLRTAFLGSRAFGRVMVRQRSGCILNVSSMAAHRGMRDYGPYSAAKSALLRLTETLALELKPHGVRVLALCPGPVASRLRSSHFPDEDPRTIMQPETVAQVAVFAASDAAAGISGAWLNVSNY